MNWITNYVRPKIRALVKQRDVPDDLWDKCDACGQMIFNRELEKNLRVCPHCDHHMRLSVRRRLELLFDDGVYETRSLPKTLQDPLRFRDRKRYGERLKDAQAKTKETDAILVAIGKLGGRVAVVGAFNFSFMGGSMGIAVGEGLLTAARLAVEKGAPFIAIPASGGARMQEGILSLMQMPRSIVAVEMVRDAGLPYFVLLTDPTTGGVSASFAMLGDIAISEPGAIIGFAGKRVIQETIRETLPDGFQKAEYLLAHGMVDMVVARKDLPTTIARLIDIIMTGKPAVAAVEEPEPEPVAETAEPEETPEKAEAVVEEAARKATTADDEDEGDAARQ